MKNTAITLSIERKEERIEWFKSRRKETGDNHLYLPHEEVLKQEIEFDKKLRDTTEREQIESAHLDGQSLWSETTDKENSKFYYQNTYGNGE